MSRLQRMRIKQKKQEKIWLFKKIVLPLHSLNNKVPWMSGLVNGLQNRLRRFESARHLKSKVNRKRVHTTLFFYITKILHKPHSFHQDIINQSTKKMCGLFSSSVFTGTTKINERTQKICFLEILCVSLCIILKTTCP